MRSDRVSYVGGKITTADGKVTEFYIGDDGSWQQWGGTHEELGETSEPLSAMAEALAEYLGPEEERDE